MKEYLKKVLPLFAILVVVFVVANLLFPHLSVNGKKVAVVSLVIFIVASSYVAMQFNRQSDNRQDQNTKGE